MALIDNLSAVGTASFDATGILESLGLITDYCDKEAKKADKQSAAINTAGKKDPRDALASLPKASSSGLFSSIGSSSPINASKIFDDVIAKKGQEAANILIDKTVARAKEEFSTKEQQLQKMLNQKFDIIKSVNDAWKVAQNTISLIMTTNGTELYLLTMQNLAKTIIKKIQEREQDIEDIKTYSNLLYNNLRFVINGSDQARLYLERLRRVLQSLIAEEANLRQIRNNLARRQVFQKRAYDALTNRLDLLIQQMRPAGKQVTGSFFQNQVDTILPEPLKKQAKSKLGNTATELEQLLDFKEEEERFQTLISIHLTIEKLGLASINYSLKTSEINALLSAFIAGASEFQNLSRSNGFNQALINHMDGSLDDLSKLILTMDSELATQNPTAPQKPFQKSRISLLGPSWAISLTSIVAHMRTLPGISADSLTKQQQAVDSFLRAIRSLEAIDSRAGGIATMSVTDAKEVPTQLTTETTRVIGATFRAITAFDVPPETTQRFKYIRDRAQLSLNLGREIIGILTPFARLQSQAILSAQSLASNMKSMLKSMGFDKASDQIDLGQIDKTLKGGAQAATYVGSAILAVNTIINALKECPATDERDVQALETARNELRGDEIRKELSARRVAANSKRDRLLQISDRKQVVQNRCTRVSSISNKCVPQAQQTKTVSEQIRNVTGGIIDFGRVI